MSLQLKLTEGSNCKSLDVTEFLPSCDESEGEEEGGGGCSGGYELMMAVGHVKEAWMEVPGNLVAHIKVGPSYHLRKEVSSSSHTCTCIEIVGLGEGGGLGELGYVPALSVAAMSSVMQA